MKCRSNGLGSQEKSDRRMLWLGFTGLKWGPGPHEGIEVETAPVGFMMPAGRSASGGEEIWVNVSPCPILFFQNQAGTASGYSGSTYSHSPNSIALF